MNRRHFLTGGAAAAMLPCAARAQAWPARNITLVVPFPPGGTNDIFARAIADKLGMALGVAVIIDNRGGAGGTIGSTAVARAAPDGYTLMTGHIGTLGVNPSLYPNLAYDTSRFSSQESSRSRHRSVVCRRRALSFPAACAGRPSPSWSLRHARRAKAR